MIVFLLGACERPLDSGDKPLDPVRDGADSSGSFDSGGDTETSELETIVTERTTTGTAPSTKGSPTRTATAWPTALTATARP